MKTEIHNFHKIINSNLAITLPEGTAQSYRKRKTALTQTLIQIRAQATYRLSGVMVLSL